MEWFKVHAGSRVTRATRVFVMAFAPCPRFPPTVLLAAAIHVSFFAHRFLPDIRLALIVATIARGWRTRIRFRIHDRHGWMPLTVAALLSALALWVAESRAPRPAPGPAMARSGARWSASSSLARGIFRSMWPSSP